MSDSSITMAVIGVALPRATALAYAAIESMIDRGMIRSVMTLMLNGTSRGRRG